MIMKRILSVLAVGLFATIGAAQAASVERGDYLVNSIMACGSCHTPFGPVGFDASKSLSGRLVDQSDAFTAIAPNITPGARVAGWSDAELAKAIREGLRPDGSLIGPPMPFELYSKISDEDLASIVAYLRTVPSVENDPGVSTYNIPLPPAYGPPITSVAAVSGGVTVEYGEYLAGPLGHCMVCHTKFDEQSRPQFETMLGSGGNAFHGPWGTVVAANLTPVGLAGYTDEHVITLITKGERPDGTTLTGPMAFPFYAKMKTDDLKAIVAYLRALPSIARP
jgi:mono/diheme cytochrome c family protein